MTRTANRDRPHLFMLRVWVEAPNSATVEWRGKVQSLADGEAYYFRTWEGLIAHLQTMMAAGHSDAPGSELSSELHGGDVA